ncbi:class I SAM-dependent methyltransferase [Persicimonas caeni]|nr:class I SAM-dependent methyltransferase [Persicimonas caeni]
MSRSEYCLICDTPVDNYQTTTLLGRHTASFFRCPNCGFIQTEEPHWLSEAYQDAITSTDVGMVSRSQHCARWTSALIHLFFDASGEFLDHGAGYGLFVRMMRDRGFDFYYRDQYSSNLFGGQVEVALTDTRVYDLITCFEVFEHMRNPREQIHSLWAQSNAIFFSTLLVPSTPPRLDEWWYFGREHGQHISFFTHAALSELADQLGCHLTSDGAGLHLFSERKIPDLALDLIKRPIVSRVLKRLFDRPSLQPHDYELALAQALEHRTK